MTRIIKTLTALSIFITVSLITTILCTANSSVGFSTTPVLPENQRQNGTSFFDLLVQPGQKQELVVIVRNESDESISVLAEVVTASTNRNGDVNYTASDANMDETLRISMEDILTLPQDRYTVPANSEILLPVNLELPNESFEGIILGSIRVVKEITEEEKAAGGAIVNQFAYVTAVRLAMSEDAESISPDFAMGEITAELVNHRASIVAQIRNTQPMLVKGTSITAKIFRQDSDQSIFEYDMPDVSFAPNSIFPLSFVDSAGYGIDAGEYKAEISVEYQEKKWVFEQEFSISAQSAASINESAVNQQTVQNNPIIPEIAASTPEWVLYAGLAVGIVISLCLLIMTIVKIRNKMKPVYIEDLLKSEYRPVKERTV